ncbi:ESF1 homolog [Uranotaenia lowii]|uniref:ESF1 homolog n=1 Tax=Uranotaenia lowii TaxID=190385 RepID=UPI00247913A5|nr:ESF1 homolog [Uranotaenia lowii]
MAKSKKDKQLKAYGTQKQQQSSNGKGQASSSSSSSHIWNDARFAHLVNDPRFKGIPKAEKKVTIDKRFQSMFNDERFNVKHTIDKYGRKVKQGGSEELRKYYQVESSEEGSSTGEEEVEEKKVKPKPKKQVEKKPAVAEKSDESSGEDESDSDSDSLELDEEEKAFAMSDQVKNRLKDMEVDYARGEAAIASDSSSDDDEDSAGEGEGDDDEVFIEHVWGELDADAETTDESTARLAICNLDWDRIRAVDIMVMLSSFLPRGSTILSVTIYPSEFGKERMREEEERGPQELTGRDQAIDADSDSEEPKTEEELKEAQMEKLREYQLNRLKYYYAVVQCDRVETADKLYKECDGVEYESTANKLDLRFIPDDMEFEDEPKDRCIELPEIGKYEPRVFTTTALNQAKVELTWDENDVERKEFNEKIRTGKLSELTDIDLKRYVACSSSEGEGEDEEREIAEPSSEEENSTDEEDEPESQKLSKKSKKEDMISKYRALLGEIKEQEEQDKTDKVEMEFSWKVNGKETEEASENDSESDSGKKKADNANPFEKILEKAKEKKKRRKELKKKKKRGELDGDKDQEGSDSEDDLPYGVDLNDPYFASAFDEKEFDLKKSKKKDKKNKSKDEDEEDEEEAARKRAELELILDDADDDKSHFNLKQILENEIDLKSVSKSKRKRILKKTKKQIEEQKQQKSAIQGGDDFQLDVDDSRFNAVFEKPEFNIDPTNPAFKKTKGMEKLIEEKLKKRPLTKEDLPIESSVGQQEAKKAKRDVSTSLLVKSIKRKIGK